MFFNISCYIVEINEKKIKVTIDEEEDLERFKKNLSLLYNSKRKKNIVIKPDINKNLYTITINQQTKFDISRYTYNDIEDLIGVRVNISGESRYYKFYTTNDIVNTLTGSKSFKSGYNLIANKIYN